MWGPWTYREVCERVDQQLARARSRKVSKSSWDILIGDYPYHVEKLEVTLGTALRNLHPRVLSHHTQGRLEFTDGTTARSLTLFHIAEPLLTPLGWGGAALQARGADGPLHLPVRDLFLTFARGTEVPEWVGRLGGLRLRRAVPVDAAFAHDVAIRVFGPPTEAQQSPDDF